MAIVTSFPVPRCQCSEKCKKPPLKNKPYCFQHRYCKNFSPTTGYEPTFYPQKFNKTRRVKESHNCFAYAFDYIDIPKTSDCNEKKCNIPYHQPGYASGYPKWSEIKTKRCPELLARLRGDIPGLIAPVRFEDKCPPKTSKVGVMKTRKNTDYHFVRQDRDGRWSHKPGGTEVTNKDASGRVIIRPDLADWDYTKKGSDLNYEIFCAYMCVPKNRKLKFKRGGKRTRKNTN